MAGLTDKKIEKLLPREKSYDEKIDSKGFILRVMPSGEKSFCLCTRYPGSKNPTRRALGSFPDMKLEPAKDEKASNAWAEVIRWRQLIKAGIDPSAEAKERRAEQERERQRKTDEAKRIVTVGALVERYLAERKEELGAVWLVEVTRYLQRSLATLHPIPIQELSRLHIATALDAVRDSSAVTAAKRGVKAQAGMTSVNRARSALSAFIDWTIEKGYREGNPTKAIGRRKRTKAEPEEKRVLSEDELVAVWRALPDSDYGSIVRLLVLSAQRRDEIADLKWSEVNFDKAQIELPESRTKNGRAHVIPLSQEALTILQSQPRYPRDYVFGSGKAGFCGWSAAKDRLDAKLPGMKAWTLHDLRRSAITHMIENGFAAPHVAEALANHVSGHRAGVAGIYDRAPHADAKHKAVQAWGQHIAYLVSGKVTCGQAA